MSQLSKLRKADLISLVESLQTQLTELTAKPSPVVATNANTINSTVKAFDINVKELDAARIDAICTIIKKYSGLSLTLKGQAGHIDLINVYIKKGPRPANLVLDFVTKVLNINEKDITLR